jgi:hypothetical protein
LAGKRGGGLGVQVAKTLEVSVLFHRADEGGVKNLKNISNLCLTVKRGACRIGVRL